MENFSVSLSDPPMTSLMIDQLRHKTSTVLASLKQRKLFYKYICGGSAFAAILLLLFLFLSGYIAYFTILSTLCLIVFVIFDAYVGGIISIFVASFILLASSVSDQIPILDAFVTLSLGLGSFVVFKIWELRIKKPFALSRKLLSETTELNHNDDPEECINFVKWCTEDETLRAFQNQLARIGRHPIRAEYLAAKEWYFRALPSRKDKEKKELD